MNFLHNDCSTSEEMGQNQVKRQERLWSSLGGAIPPPKLLGLTVPVSLAEAGHGTSQEKPTMATDVVKQIRKATRRKFTAEEKIRVVLEGLRGETPISEICRRHSIPSSIYYKWSKAFLDAGKNGLTRDTQRDATSDEVRRLKDENASLKTAVAETILENQRLKKSLGL